MGRFDEWWVAVNFVGSSQAVAGADELWRPAMRYNEPAPATSASPNSTEVRVTMMMFPTLRARENMYDNNQYNESLGCVEAKRLVQNLFLQQSCGDQGN